MKNKVLIGALTVLLVIGMVSCSMDEYAKLGEAMGKMGNNVYGIEPNMQEVNETTKKFDDKVTKNEAGDVEVELVDPADLISSVAEIKNSTKKTEELKKQLDEPLANDDVTGEEIQKALQNKVDKIISEATKNVDEEALKEADEKIQSAYQSVTKALDDIKESISDNPTKADLATVSIINDLATTVSNIASNPDDYMKGDELDTDKIITEANKALQALDALKVTSTAADLDILKDFNLASLFSSSNSGSKALSDDSASQEDEDAMKKFMFSAIDSFTKMVCVDGKFNEVKYNRFIFQMRAIRTAYETTAWLVTPSLRGYENQFAVVDAIINGKNIIGLDSFSVNDLVLYAASVVFTECDKFQVKEGSSLSFKGAVEAYINQDSSKLGDDEDLAKRFEMFENFFNDVDLGKMGGYVEHLERSAVTAVNTAAVILVDSGFDLKVIEKFGFKPEESKSYGDELKKAFENLKNELGKNN